MYYLKYRPSKIEEVDNSRVRTIISNYLTKTDIPHAWLFVGHKGMGKTSVARILAKELCKTGRSETDVILSKEIEEGTSADVQEINGADNTGIDDVRKLIENIAYTPMIAKYRMYIIDEVHMLSGSAFNGLLKILEEPPKHAIFILATTLVDKIPATVQSRCVKVDFGTAKAEDITAMLDRIAEGENLKISDETKSLIIKSSDRSFRDATKILEELVSQNSLDPLKAGAYIGLRSKDEVLSFFERKDVAGGIAWINTFTTDGGDSKLLIEESIRKVHALILKHFGVDPDFPVGDYKFSLADLAKLQKLLHEAYNASRSSPVPSTALQLCMIEFGKQKEH
jgi:DNA polymerase III subunit gamma/tau